jgi:5'-3' exonuclease
MKLVPKRRVLIVDGNNIAWRWIMVNPNEQLKTTTGIVTTVCYGLIESVLKANRCLSELATSRTNTIQKIYYDDVIICWDARGKNWRHEIDPAYKQSRSDEKRRALKAEIMPYIDTAQDFLAALNVKQIKVDGLEGDDIMAVLSEMYTESGWTATILSGDKDMWQLLKWGKTIIHDGKETFRDEGWFRSEYGFSPLRWPEAKALMGDKGDDVAGVKGIGDKLSRAIVNSCDNILMMDVDALPKISRFTEAKKEALKEFIKAGNLSRNHILVKLTPNLSELQMTGDHLQNFQTEYAKIAKQAVIDPSMFFATLQYYEMKRFLSGHKELMTSLGLKGS